MGGGNGNVVVVGVMQASADTKLFVYLIFARNIYPTFLLSNKIFLFF